MENDEDVSPPIHTIIDFSLSHPLGSTLARDGYLDHTWEGGYGFRLYSLVKLTYKINDNLPIGIITNIDSNFVTFYWIDINSSETIGREIALCVAKLT
jgi:hypothetical protein